MAHPIFYYDGTCRFCRMWSAHWKHRVGSRVRLRPFPPVPAVRSSEFVDADGRVWRGAAGVFRMRGGLGAWCYARVPLFAPISELVYRGVSSCRVCAYKLTKWMFRHRKLLPPV